MLTLAMATGLVRAQDSVRPDGSSQPPQITFRSGVEVVTVSASVRDSRGRVVRNLRRADFEVIDTGSTRQIKDFHSGDAAISLGVLLDISGSMAVGGNIDRAREAVELVFANLQDGRDEAALFTFDAELQQVARFTTDIDHLSALNLQGKPYGMTSLFDAVAAASREVADRRNHHRALFVITDGIDTRSRLTARQVSAIASSIDVPVYLLTVVNPLDHPGGDFGVVEAHDIDSPTGTLADLARWTGGDMQISSVHVHTMRAVQTLVDELRHQYLITFEPGERPGWHPLEIRTRKKNLVVRARNGYMSGAARFGSS
jgi:Ca-activated chloride channel family protein